MQVSRHSTDPTLLNDLDIKIGFPDRTCMVTSITSVPDDEKSALINTRESDFSEVPRLTQGPIESTFRRPIKSLVASHRSSGAKKLVLGEDKTNYSCIIKEEEV